MRSDLSSDFRALTIMRVGLLTLGLLGVSLLDEHRAIGQDRSAAAVRASNLFGLEGPLVTATVAFQP